MASKKENRSKRIKAFGYYLDDRTQRDISQLCDVDENTVSRWKREDKWEERYEEEKGSDRAIVLGVKKIALHNIKVINKQIEDQEKGGDLELVGPATINSITGLVSKVSFGRVTPADKVNVLEEFLRYLSDTEPKLAKELSPLIIEFAKTLNG